MCPGELEETAQKWRVQDGFGRMSVSLLDGKQVITGNGDSTDEGSLIKKKYTY